MPPFYVIITDSSNPQRSEEVPITITIVETLPELIAIRGGVCIVNQDCTIQVATAQDGLPPYHFQSDTFANGAPPMGMIVDLDGVLIGTPAQKGTYTFGVCVVDVVGASKCGQTQVIVEEKPEVKEISSDDEGSDFCSSDADCSGFGARQCSGAANARCGQDGLCHCCLTLCPGGENCQCIDCSTGCGGGTYCERDACVFEAGGNP